MDRSVIFFSTSREVIRLVSAQGFYGKFAGYSFLELASRVLISERGEESQEGNDLRSYKFFAP